MTDGMQRRLSDQSGGHDNPTFVGDVSSTLPGESRRRSNMTEFYPGKYAAPTAIQVHDVKDKPHRLDITRPTAPTASNEKMPPGEPAKERDNWGKGIEFLLSCIAMSVGLGNIWR